MVGETPTLGRVILHSIKDIIRPTRIVRADDGEGDGGENPPPPDEGEAPPETGGETDAKVKAAREEAISERKKRQELEAKVKEYEEAKLTEAERKDRALAEAEREKLALTERLQALEIDRAVERAATKAGMRDPSDAVLTINRTLLEFEEDGSPKEASVATALEDLKGRKPHLFGEEPPGSADGGARSPASVTPDLREMVSRVPRL